MTTRRKTKWIIASVIALTLVIAAAVTSELLARNKLESRISDLGSTLPGVSTALAGGPALLQLASGRIDVQLAVSDAALDTYARCRTEQDLSVHAAEGGLTVTTERTMRGMTLPVDVTLVPRKDGDRWLLVADSVSAAGISLPADRALKVLGGKDGSDSKLATRLLDGIPLPSDDRLAITSIRVTDGAVLVTASTAINRTGDAQGGGLSGLRSCLDSPEG